MSSSSSPLSSLPSRRPRCPPLSGAFFAPSDLPALALLRSLSALSASLLAPLAAGPPPLHRRSRRSLTRKIGLLSNLFDFLQGSMSGRSISRTATLCFRELYVFLCRAKSLLDYCSQSSRIWLVIRNPQICGDFHDLEQELATVLDVLPLRELRLTGDIVEQVELLRKQGRESGIRVDDAEERLCRKVYSFLSEFERGEVPDRSELLELFVDGLGIRDARACRTEMELLEEQIVCLEEGFNLSVLGGCLALSRFCRFFLFGFEERWFVSGDDDLSKKLPRRLVSQSSSDCSFVIPKDFCCPISLDLMRDPVVVSTGQTYDRASIVQWMEEGHRTCPNSGQNLTSDRLIANRALRSLISLWCAANEIAYDALDNSSVNSSDNISLASSSKAAIEASRGLARLLMKELIDGLDKTKAVAVRELRLLAKIGKENRAVIAELGAIPLLCRLFRSPDCIAQENAATAILNLSIHDENKIKIMEEEGCLEQIVHVLRHGMTTEARENAAATLFSLSAVHDHKLRIVKEQGAVAALAKLLLEGSTRGKKDAVMALFNISTHPDSWSYMLDFGAVSALVSALRNEMVAEEAAGALALLVKQTMVAEMVGNEDTALTNLIGVMRRGTPKGKENAVAALQEMCRQGGLHVTKRVAAMPALHGLIQDILSNGTKRAKRKASQLAKMCRRSEATTSTAVNTPATGGWAINNTLTRNVSFGSGEIASAPMVPVL